MNSIRDEVYNNIIMKQVLDNPERFADIDYKLMHSFNDMPKTFQRRAQKAGYTTLRTPRSIRLYF